MLISAHRIVGGHMESTDRSDHPLAASRERAASLLPGVPVLPVPDVVAAAELVLLTVPDDELAPLVRGLTATGAWVPGQLVVHTSGRHGLAVMEPARASVSPLALHPAMTFEGSSVDLQRLAGCCFGVTAPPALRLVGEALVVEMGGEPVWLTSPGVYCIVARDPVVGVRMLRKGEGEQ